MSANEKAQKRVNIMVGFMITAFIVAWTPYSIVSLMETFAEESGGFQISPGAATIPSLFAKGSIVFNPLIYGVFNTQVGYSRPPFSPPSLPIRPISISWQYRNVGDACGITHVSILQSRARRGLNQARQFPSLALNGLGNDRIKTTKTMETPWNMMQSFMI